MVGLYLADALVYTAVVITAWLLQLAGIQLHGVLGPDTGRRYPLPPRHVPPGRTCQQNDVDASVRRGRVAGNVRRACRMAGTDRRRAGSG